MTILIFNRAQIILFERVTQTQMEKLILILIAKIFNNDSFS
ncbi:hypothetical protein NARC_60175 [Candidatus Nitrosocosmicus arcticus]|uniref:Uncharacterized protein n=1 Tax=Candidatus Nitrosocosmicus arcticus TaxID=2035267 RepID=A0A557SW06_9ARCH|nr:hypothetical protein NARC_60175 [Candidatus Nitrosocosmicus arcticus]